MNRFFGRDKRKKRLSPIAKSREAALTANPMYQYALQEYAQTVAPPSSIDSGRHARRAQIQSTQQQQQQQVSLAESLSSSSAAGAATAAALSTNASMSSSLSHQHPTHTQQQLQQQQQQPQLQQQPQRSLPPQDTHIQNQNSNSSNNNNNNNNNNKVQPPITTTAAPIPAASDAPIMDSIRPSMSILSALSDDNGGGGHGGGGGGGASYQPNSPGSIAAAPPFSPASFYYNQAGGFPPSSSRRDYNEYDDDCDCDDPMIPDASYEEYYGDAYVGAPIKYIYPSGYQSMRPRGGPWKLSIVVCVIFTWLSIFIVGHCSDRAAQSLYSAEIDDDAIKKRWCGSRLLYLMWVISMSITGLAAAYCSVIGYIKVRDFAVANCRSQPSVSVGKSDYYIQIHDNNNNNNSQHPSQQQQQTSQSTSTSQQPLHYIYQADGTPRFWGAHIYRPTQAAVAVTSR